jgi:hypothetical protein
MAASFMQTVTFFGADQPKAHGVHVFAYDADIDTAASLVSTYASFAQLAAQDSLEAISSNANDITQSITVIGVDSGGRRQHTTKLLNGTTVVTLDRTWRYVENCYTNMECAGNITLRRATGDTAINVIAIGQVAADVVQHFSGDDNICWLLGWWAGTPYAQDQGAFFELRWYPSDADSLDSGDGYRVLDRIDVDTDGDATGPGSVRVTFPSPIQLPAGGWVVVFGDSEGDNQVGYAGLQIIDVAIPGAAVPQPTKLTSS